MEWFQYLSYPKSLLYVLREFVVL